MRILTIAFLPSLFCAAFMSLAEEANDPTLWTAPKERPALKTIPPDSPALEAQFEAARKRLAKFEAELAVLPKHGYCVNIVSAGSQAEKLGLKKGDVVVKIDDKDVEGDF